MTPEPVTASILTAAYRRGELSPVDEIEARLRRIEALDSRIQAWVEVDRERARHDASARHEAMQNGRLSGALFGVGVGIKDIIDVAGLPTRAGAAAFAHRTPTVDATVVARLRQAGAIVLGKTATTQFAYIDPAPTRNPWDLGHTPGGSSSGSAAAVASRMATLAIGSQTVGSVLRPAAYCGVVGFKPSHGRVSVEGVVPLAPTLDHVGIFSRSVADVALVLGVIGEAKPGEGLPALPAELQQSQSPPSLGILRTFYAERANPEIVAHLDRLVALLGEAKGAVEQVRLPFMPEDVLNVSNTLLRVESARYHRQMFAANAADYSPNLGRLIASGLATSAADYETALAGREAVRRAMAPMLETFDALLLPSAPSTAPLGLGSTGDPVFCALASVAGIPSISLPSGLGEGGLPLAVQLVGRQGGEAAFLAVAGWVEERLAFSAEPPLLEGVG